MPSPWKNRLTGDEIDALDRMRMKAPRADVFRNGTILLMSDAGRTKRSISEDWGCCPATVERVRGLYRTLGLLGMTPIKPPGRPSRLSQALREPVLEAVQTHPRELGYGFSTWSVARLTEHIRRHSRLRAGPGTVRRVLAHEQFSLRRPKHTLQGKRDDRAHAEAKTEPRRLKKKRRARTPPRPSSSKTKPKFTYIHS